MAIDVRRTASVLFLVSIAAGPSLFCAGCNSRGKGDGSPTGREPSSGSLARTEVSLVGKALAEAQADFSCRGKPIHPGVVYHLISWGYDEHPVTVSVDPLAAHNHNEYSRFEVKFRDGWIECRLNDVRPALQDYETFAYRCLGVLANGTQVLYTRYSGGGSGDYCRLMFIRFGIEKAYDIAAEPYARLIMKVICVFILGDRDDGEVTVLGDRVIVGRSKYRDKEIVLKLE